MNYYIIAIVDLETLDRFTMFVFSSLNTTENCILALYKMF